MKAMCHGVLVLAAVMGMVAVPAASAVDYYVKHAGNDSAAGTSWGTAFATLQKALTTAPANTPVIVYVQASTGAQAYAVCTRTQTSRPENLTIDFLGGWENIEGTPTPTGFSVVKDASASKPGIQMASSNHDQAKTIRISRFSFSDVTRAVELSGGTGNDSSGITLTISNTTVRAKNDGVYLSYPHTFNFGPCRLTAENVDIIAGMSGPGHALYIAGYWNGSVVRGVGGGVSSLTSSNGCGASYSAINLGGHSASFLETVISGCSSNGIHLDAALKNWTVPGTGSNRVTAVLSKCTIVDNAGNGLHLLSATAGSSATVNDCIFANNGGNGLNLEGPAGVYTCSEGYNVFYNDDIVVSGANGSFAGTTAITDPLFYARRDKPDPWYRLGFKSSPAFRSATDGGHRGAYQVERLLIKGTVVVFK